MTDQSQMVTIYGITASFRVWLANLRWRWLNRSLERHFRLEFPLCRGLVNTQVIFRSYRMEAHRPARGPIPSIPHEVLAKGKRRILDYCIGELEKKLQRDDRYLIRTAPHLISGIGDGGQIKTQLRYRILVEESN